MGIDIYAQWDGQTYHERKAQAEAWLSDNGGQVGYLREAYHGEPYATRHLVPEAFESGDGAYIAAATLQSVAEINVPDVWHTIMVVQDQVEGIPTRKFTTADAEMLLETWHLCKDLLTHIKRVNREPNTA